MSLGEAAVGGKGGGSPHCGKVTASFKQQVLLGVLSRHSAGQQAAVPHYPQVSPIKTHHCIILQSSVQWPMWVEASGCCAGEPGGQPGKWSCAHAAPFHTEGPGLAGSALQRVSLFLTKSKAFCLEF